MKDFLRTLAILSVLISPALALAQIDDTSPDGETGECIILANNMGYRSTDARTGGEVSVLQDFLQSRGFLNSEPTGFFGVLTQRAVRSFQAQQLSNVSINDIDASLVSNASTRTILANNGFVLGQTGYVGAYTRAKIKYITCNNVSASLPEIPTPTPVSPTAVVNVTTGTAANPNHVSYTVVFSGTVSSQSGTNGASVTTYFDWGFSATNLTQQSTSHNNGVITGNDVRNILGYATIERGNTIYYRAVAVISRVNGYDYVRGQVRSYYIPTFSSLATPTLTAGPTSGPAPLSVLFSVGNITSTNYTIDFGDGTSGSVIVVGQVLCVSGSTTCNPNLYGAYHNYSSAGTYTAKLLGTCVGDSFSCSALPNAGRPVLGTVMLTVTSTSSVLSCILTTNKNSYQYGETIIFSWTSQNATYASFWQDNTGRDHLLLPGDRLSTSGSQSVTANVYGNPSATLLIYSQYGSNSCSVTVAVSQPSPTPSLTPPTLAVSADSTLITSGQSTTIYWSSENATACTLNGGQPVSLSGSVSTGALSHKMTYQISCSGSGGTVTRDITIDVNTVTTPTASPELHAVGVYEAGSDHNYCYSTVAQAYVRVRNTGKPIILALSAYEPVKWNITLDSGAVVSQIILGGFNRQNINDVPVPVTGQYTLYTGLASQGVENSSGRFLSASSPEGKIYNASGSCPESVAVPMSNRIYLISGGSEYYYPYQQSGSEYDRWVNKLRTVTGLSPTSFQGTYSGSSFTVPPQTTSSINTGSQLGSAISAFSQISGVAVINLPKDEGQNFSYSFSSDLYRGVMSDEVRALQQALSLQGIYRAEITGNFYDHTLEAVKNFQQKYGISPTGYVGATTRTKLNELYGR